VKGSYFWMIGIPGGEQQEEKQRGTEDQVNNVSVDAGAVREEGKA